MGALRTVAALASVSCFIQGVVWCVLSLLAVLSYTCNFSPSNDFLDQSYSAMAKIYFTDPSCWDGGSEIKKLGLTSASEMVTLTSLQFVFNFLMAITALLLLFIIPRGSSYCFLTWLYSLILFWMGTAVLDLLTSTKLASDKDMLKDGTSTIPIKNGLSNMLLVSSLIAARGYLYWALNVILMLYLLLASTMRIAKGCKKLDEPSNPGGTVNPAYESDERGIPAHTAKSRWPQLGVPLWRRQVLSEELTLNHRAGERDELRDRMGFGKREAFRTTSNDAFYRNGYAGNHQPNYPADRGLSANQQNFTRNGVLENQRGKPFKNSYLESQPNGSPMYRWEVWPTEQTRTSNPNQRQQSGSTEILGNGHERQRPEHSVPRPNSLHEAILTVKPLKQVRPRLTDMQTKF